MKGADELSTKEQDRLNDWLIAHGHTAEEALECTKYIAWGEAPETCCDKQ